MAWEEDSCICLNMQLIAILSRIGVITDSELMEQIVNTVRESPTANKKMLRDFGIM